MSVELKRLDYRIINQIIEPGAKVLDLGCGDGELLFFLIKEKNTKAQGIELKDEAIYKCVEKGLSVFHGDIDSGLSEYPNKSFDYVILNQTMQESRKVDFVINNTNYVHRDTSHRKIAYTNELDMSLSYNLLENKDISF